MKSVFQTMAVIGLPACAVPPTVKRTSAIQARGNCFHVHLLSPFLFLNPRSRPRHAARNTITGINIVLFADYLYASLMTFSINTCICALTAAAASLSLGFASGHVLISTATLLPLIFPGLLILAAKAWLGIV